MQSPSETLYDATTMNPLLQRRRLLAGTVAGLGAIASTPASLAKEAASARGSASLALTAQTTEGPYYLPDMPLRADITEGAAGIPLALQLRVLDAAGAVQPDCRVDVWQCDAAGLYSGFSGQGDDGKTATHGRTWLRGAQVTAADGMARFLSIYPGWYAGRTAHVHFKVWMQGRAVLTSQFFLPDALSEYLYTSLPPYQRKTLRGVLNSTDGIALAAGRSVLGSVHEEPDRYVAALTVVVDPQASPATWRPGDGPPPPGMRGAGGPPPGFGGRPPLPVPQGNARPVAMVPGPRPVKDKGD